MNADAPLPSPAASAPCEPPLSWRVLTLRLDAQGAFDDAPLRELSRAARITHLSHHLVDPGGAPRLAVIVGLHPPAGEATAEAEVAPPAARAEKKDPTDGLDERELALYEALRDWRNDQAAAASLPRYLVLANRELAEIARRRPTSPEELADVRGMGPRRSERYGDTILAIVAATSDA